jgi:NodT family efflux transporter outer membrane factor (OMF) lipoprotein
LLLGCSHVPQPLPPDAPPASAAEQPLARWWLQLNDPALAAQVAQALQANPGLLGAWATLRQARALRDLAAAGLWPTLGSSASAQRGRAGGESTGNSFRLGLQADWAPDLAGATRLGLQAADADVRASAASLDDVQAQLVAEVVLAALLQRSGQARLAIARANLASQQQTLQIAGWREQAGLSTALDTAQARAAAAETAAQLPLLQTSIAQAGHALAVLQGLSPPMPVPMTETPVLDLPTFPALPDLPADTLRRRADVRAAEWQVAAALARTGQAQADRAPRFAIGGTLGLAAATLGGLGSGSAVLGTLLASVSWPLFDAGAGAARVAAQQAALEGQQEAYRSAVGVAQRDVADALAALQGDRQRLARLGEAAAAATLAGTLARQRYTSGLVDFQTVLSTQRTQYATQDSVASARAEVGADQVRLVRALGGGAAVTP